MKWHEPFLETLSSVFSRVDETLKLLARIDRAILSPETDLETTLRDLCHDLCKLTGSESADIVLADGTEWIPMGLSNLGIPLDKLPSVGDCKAQPLVDVVSDASSEDASVAADIAVYPISSGGAVLGALVLVRNAKARSSVDDALSVQFARLVPNQISILIGSYLDREKTNNENRLARLFFNVKLKPSYCWQQVVTQVVSFMPPFTALKLTPPPKAQLLSYRSGDLTLRIVGTQGDERVGTEVKIDESICGLLFDGSSADVICVDPDDYRNRYRSFLYGHGAVVRSELAVAIRHEGQVVGVLNLEHPSEQAFRSQHIEAMRSLSKFIGPFVAALQTRALAQRSKELAVLYTMHHLLERMAGTYQHLLGQPLLNIRLTLETLNEALAEAPESITKELKSLTTEMERIHLSSDRFCYGLPEFIKYGPVGLDGAVTTALSLMNKKRLRDEDSVTIVNEVSERLPRVYASPMLEEHIYNLVNNSLYSVKEAIASGKRKDGLITIHAEERGVKDNLDQDTASRQVVVRITDNGLGAPKECEEKIGRPRFTTKGEKGTGFGLAAAIDYTQSVGGNLRWENSPGEGFVVEFYLDQFDPTKHKD